MVARKRSGVPAAAGTPPPEEGAARAAAVPADATTPLLVLALALCAGLLATTCPGLKGADELRAEEEAAAAAEAAFTAADVAYATVIPGVDYYPLFDDPLPAGSLGFAPLSSEELFQPGAAVTQGWTDVWLEAGGSPGGAQQQSQQHETHFLYGGEAVHSPRGAQQPASSTTRTKVPQERPTTISVSAFTSAFVSASLDPESLLEATRSEVEAFCASRDRGQALHGPERPAIVRLSPQHFKLMDHCEAQRVALGRADDALAKSASWQHSLPKYP